MLLVSGNIGRSQPIGARPRAIAECPELDWL